MNDVEGYKQCLNDFNEELKRIISKRNGVETMRDAWSAFSDVIYWSQSKRLDINITENQPVGGM